MKIDFNMAEVTIRAEELKIVEDSFIQWCSESGYVTGSWNTGTDVNDKTGEYWEFVSMTALEQLKSIIKKNLNIIYEKKNKRIMFTVIERKGKFFIKSDDLGLVEQSIDKFGIYWEGDGPLMGVSDLRYCIEQIKDQQGLPSKFTEKKK